MTAPYDQPATSQETHAYDRACRNTQHDGCTCMHLIDGLWCGKPRHHPIHEYDDWVERLDPHARDKVEQMNDRNTYLTDSWRSERDRADRAEAKHARCTNLSNAEASRIFEEAREQRERADRAEAALRSFEWLPQLAVSGEMRRFCPVCHRAAEQSELSRRLNRGLRDDNHRRDCALALALDALVAAPPAADDQQEGPG